MRLLLVVGLALVLGAAGLAALVMQPFVAPRESAAPAVDPERLKAHVQRLSVDLYPRSFDHEVQLEAAAQYILAEFEAAGAIVSVQDAVVEEATYKNVIARFGARTGGRLVVGAHYDSHAHVSAAIGDPRGYSPATHTPGADDNASGVAGLIELAHLLGRQPPSRPVELVAYALEEPPHFRTEHMGSAWHARSVAGEDVRLMLSLEMIGYFSDTPGSQRYPLPALDLVYPDRGNFVALVGAMRDFGQMRTAKAAMAGASDLAVYSINAPRWMPGVDFSDHVNYWDAKIPAIMVTDTAFWRNPHYHRPGDTYNTLDYARMARVVQGVYAITQAPW